MHRLTYVLTIILVLAACTFGFSAILPNQALLILRNNNFTDTEATITTLEYMGAHAQHVLSNKFVVAEVPPSAETGVRSLYNVYKFFRTSQSTSTYSGDDLTCVTAWNTLFSADVVGIDQMGALTNDTVPQPPHPSSAPTIPGVQSVTNHAPGYYATSEYMVGKIAVGVVVPESNGGTENWTPARLNQLFGQAVKGLNWWLRNYPGTVSATKPTFFYDKHLGVPCQYEPITCPSEDQWINDAMSNIGYSTGDKYLYLNDLRNRFHTDWAYAAYIADSLNDADGYFAYGLHAYASINGPYCVLNWKNAGWGINNFYRLFAHETGHVFGCPDEYGSCSTYEMGYLSIPNMNCEYTNPNAVPCMMRANTAVEPACQYTIGHLGWRDSDSDGIPDTTDNPVVLTINSQSMVDENGLVTINGTADNIPYDSPTHTDCTVSKITAVKYRVDGGYWTSATPADGKWDQQTEEFSFTTPALDNGDHVINIQAFSNSGNSSEIMNRVVDRTAPMMGQVTDDGSYTYDETRLYASWTATEPDSEITEYKYAIGTTPTDPGLNYVRDWTSTGSDAFVTAKGLNLTEGTTYYFYVKAMNSSGYWSDVAASDGIRLSIISIDQAKQLAAGTWVALHNKEVVNSYGPYHYIQEQDKYAGIRLNEYTSYQLGQLITARGFLKNTEGEFQITSDSPATLGEIVEPIKPLFLTNRAIGGGKFGSQDPLWEWRWVKEEAKEKWLPLDGLNNVGILVKTTGVITFIPSYGGFAYIDDGSNLNDGNTLGPDGSAVRGIRVILPYNVELPPVGTNISVVGASVTSPSANGAVRSIQPRSQQDIGVVGDAMITGKINYEGIFSVDQTTETAHPYPSGLYTNNWTVIAPTESVRMRLHFSKLEISSGYLSISYLYGRGNLTIHSPVSYEDYWSDWIYGNGLSLRMWSSENVLGSYGFTVDKYEYKLTSVPLVGATVLLTPGNKTVVTDDQGRFVFTGIKPGTYTIKPLVGDSPVSPLDTTVKVDYEGQYIKGIDFTKN